MKFKKNYPLKKLTTMKIGGPAKYFLITRKENDLISAINWAKKNKIKWYVIGDGSNLIPGDKGFDGLIIKNEIRDANIRMPPSSRAQSVHYGAGSNDTNKSTVIVAAGNNLLQFINKLNRLGLAGMEKMAGIPGTVGGAIYGSAGAYGQEIKNNLLKIKIFDGKKTTWLSRKQCSFGYRESIFKKRKNWVILGVEFKFKKSDSKKLQKISKEIIKIRKKKYWPNLLCPGSFFKNIVIKDLGLALQQKFLSKIPKEKIIHGKVPTGYLLEMVGAKGMKCGNIRIAKHHGNLIYNSGRGKTSEIVKLAKLLKQRVRKKFGIDLEEEIQYI